jgi:signal transduction histidine kinase
VRVELGGLPARRLPSTVEVAAYFLCTEGIANVAKHAEADAVRIDMVDADDRLLVTVADDGRGGARLDGGSGLRGLADRVAALGGTLTVTSSGEGGTTLRAEIPLRATESATSAVSER